MDTDVYNILLTVAAGFLVVAFLITTWRIVIGPNSLDRLIAMDGLVAMFQCALA
eukprot:CAMPEP_0205850410 /NCGR_PEP_ID=MMETSP1019-20131125/103285_1 /ASSEMBLY_ACC=CAM_ASM_000403 /TAXON_ID=46462 /ORGANISM="Anophryoides haemophila, Strain AH6" /LENGTH=53 /DNA_ID=CAMNT_0053209049 /DNA_START=1 /DNA_END=158 /DNA_ORIENTATION=+